MKQSITEWVEGKPRLKEWLIRDRQITINTGWFCGVLFAMAGVVTLNIWAILLGCFFMFCAKMLTDRHARWAKAEAAKGK